MFVYDASDVVGFIFVALIIVGAFAIIGVNIVREVINVIRKRFFKDKTQAGSGRGG